MMGPDATIGYLFDDEALERALAEGTDEQHETLDNCDDDCLCLTSSSKEKFLNVFPDDNGNIEKFSVIRKN